MFIITFYISNGLPQEEQNFAIGFCRAIPHWVQNTPAEYPLYGGGGGISFCGGKYCGGWGIAWLNWWGTFKVIGAAAPLRPISITIYRNERYTLIVKKTEICDIHDI